MKIYDLLFYGDKKSTNNVILILGSIAASLMVFDE